MITTRKEIEKGIIERALKQGKTDFLVLMEKKFAEFIGDNLAEYGEPPISFYETIFYEYYDAVEEIVASEMLTGLMGKFGANLIGTYLKGR